MLASDAQGGPIGLALLGIRGARGWIGDFGVIPAWRRAGVGRALLGVLLDSARAAGLGDVRLEVASANTAARRLYETAGFAVTRTLRNYAARAGALRLGDAVPGISVTPGAPDLLARLDLGRPPARPPGITSYPRCLRARARPSWRCATARRPACSRSPGRPTTSRSPAPDLSGRRRRGAGAAARGLPPPGRTRARRLRGRRERAGSAVARAGIPGTGAGPGDAVRVMTRGRALTYAGASARMAHAVLPPARRCPRIPSAPRPRSR